METEVLIIGGGATGTSVARDLALRGVDCVLVEKGDLNAGASGSNHGLLHSGGRYVTNDPEAAIECREEGAIFKQIASQCVDDSGGLFVAVEGDDERFVADYPAACARCGIEARPVDPAEARAMEPALSDRVIAAFAVPDGSIDPFALSLECVAQVQSLGGRVLRRTRVVGFEREGRRLRAAILKNVETGEERRIEATQIVNASGAWADQVAALAGAHIDLVYSKGTLIITLNRLARRVINRLRPPSDADIMVPGGTVSIIGTTSVTVETLDDVRPTVGEVDRIVEEGGAMVPALEWTRYVRAYAGVRPLVGARGGGGDARSVSRGFALIDHEEDGLDNLTTITGGKLTTSRLMAERTVDLVCERLGVTAPCVTAVEPIPRSASGEWTEAGRSASRWMRAHDVDDALLCECELVSRSAVDSIVDTLRRTGEEPHLVDIGLRSRVGKGACQGAFCSARTVAHLYSRGLLTADQGVGELVRFFRERWRGQRSVLWGEQLVQAELMEAIHCGLFGEELVAEEGPR